MEDEYNKLIGNDINYIEDKFNLNYSFFLDIKDYGLNLAFSDLIESFFEVFEKEEILILKSIDDKIVEIFKFNIEKNLKELELLEKKKGLFYFDEDRLEIGDGISYCFLSKNSLVYISNYDINILTNKNNRSKVGNIIEEHIRKNKIIKKKTNKNKFSLIKEINKLEKNELKELLKDLIKFRKENKEFLELKFKSNDIDDVLDYYKEKIEKAFGFNKFSLKDARKAIIDFKKINKDEEYLIEILTYYLEVASYFDNEIGDSYEAFYTSIENTFHNLINLLNKYSDLIPKYKKRLEKIISLSCEGWGHKDILEEMYEDLEK